MNIGTWLVDSVAVKARSGSPSNKGDPAYGSQSTLSARVQMGRDRKETLIAHSAVVYTTTAIAVDSLVWLPGANTGLDSAAKRAVQTYQTHDKRGGFTLYKTLLA